MRKTVISHVEELRKRAIIVILFTILFAAVGIYFSGWFIRVLIDNLARNIPVTFVSLMPFEFIATQIKLGVMIGILLALPIVAWQGAKFILPGLRKKERKYFYTALPVSVLLFAVGFAFAYFIFLKVALVFLGGLGLRYGVENYWSIGGFVSTVFMTCVVIGAVFEMPALVFVLSKIGLLRKELLAAKRVYVYVLAFVLAATITPPDIVTQVLLAIPIILLYEISVLIVRK